MNIVKLCTTTSTNDYLKGLLTDSALPNYSVVMSDYQTQGRGQRGNTWHSEKGKNLLFSILIQNKSLLPVEQFVLNQIVSLGILEILQHYIPDVRIKWPNDIMAGSNKIAGILIENTLSGNHIKHSIIGIGLNVNQTAFPEELAHVTSMKILRHSSFNLKELAQKIVTSIQKKYNFFENGYLRSIQEQYLTNLYLYLQEASYIDQNNQEFTGEIIGLSTDGKLQVKQQDRIRTFGFKEIRFLQ